MLQNDPELFELSMSKKNSTAYGFGKKSIAKKTLSPYRLNTQLCKMRRRIGGLGIPDKLNLWKAPKKKLKS